MFTVRRTMALIGAVAAAMRYSVVIFRQENQLERKEEKKKKMKKKNKMDWQQERRVHQEC